MPEACLCCFSGLTRLLAFPTATGWSSWRTTGMLALFHHTLRANTGSMESTGCVALPWLLSFVVLILDARWLAALNAGAASWLAGHWKDGSGHLRALAVGAVQDARCIFAIHNLSHQGVDPAATFSNFGLPEPWSAS